jgi:hypothetical protein
LPLVRHDQGDPIGDNLDETLSLNCPKRGDVEEEPEAV